LVATPEEAIGQKGFHFSHNREKKIRRHDTDLEVWEASLGKDLFAMLKDVGDLNNFTKACCTEAMHQHFYAEMRKQNDTQLCPLPYSTN
jgi:hypothetical protein